MLAIVDYGVGNLFSLQSSFAAVGETAVVTGEAEVLRRAERLVLPGVGAFGDAIERLRQAGLDDLLRIRAAAGVPILGICLGMQLLFEQSEEYGLHNGLALLPGRVRPIAGAVPPELKIPHIGWNALCFPANCPRHPLFCGLGEQAFAYFVHSYYAAGCEPWVIATAEYGAPLTAAVARGNVCGCQFHPEKSGRVGLTILKNFCKWGGADEC